MWVPKDLVKEELRFAPNVRIFQQNVRANVANFIQDRIWGVSFSNEDFKTIEEGLGDRQDLNLSVHGLTRDAAQNMGCEEGSKKICFCFKSKPIKKKKGKTKYTFSKGLPSLALFLSLSVS